MDLVKGRLVHAAVAHLGLDVPLVVREGADVEGQVPPEPLGLVPLDVDMPAPRVVQGEEVGALAELAEVLAPEVRDEELDEGALPAAPELRHAHALPRGLAPDQQPLHAVEIRAAQIPQLPGPDLPPSPASRRGQDKRFF